MTRDWRSEAAVVTDALLSRGRAQWQGVGRFRIVDRVRRTFDPETRRAGGEPMRLVRFTPDPAFLDSLEAQAEVSVEGFGWFAVKHYGAYERRHPKTGAVIRVEAKRGVLFRSAPELRDRIEGATLPEGDDEADD